MGDNLDKKKKIWVTYLGHLFFHEEAIYEISNKHAQFKTYAMHQKMCSVQMLKMTRGHKIVLFRIYSKVNQVIYSSLPIYSLNFKALASIVFEIFY